MRCGAVPGAGGLASLHGQAGAVQCHGAVRARACALAVGTLASPGLRLSPGPRRGRPSTGWVRPLASPVRCGASRSSVGAGAVRCGGGAGGGAGGGLQGMRGVLASPGAVPGAVPVRCRGRCRCGHWQRRGGERGGLQSTGVRALVSSGRLFTIEVKPLACRGLRRIRSPEAGRRKGRPSRDGGGMIPW
jgi:hypothetical protein